MKTPGVQWKRAVAWAFYDWANSAFAVTAMAGLVPIFNKEFWSNGLPETVSTFHLGMANSIAGLSDGRARRPPWAPSPTRAAPKNGSCSLFATLGVVMTTGLFFVERGALDARAWCCMAWRSSGLPAATCFTTRCW